MRLTTFNQTFRYIRNHYWNKKTTPALNTALRKDKKQAIRALKFLGVCFTTPFFFDNCLIKKAFCEESSANNPSKAA